MALAKLFSSSLASMHIAVVVIVITLHPRKWRFDKCRHSGACSQLIVCASYVSTSEVPSELVDCLLCQSCHKLGWGRRQEAQWERA